MLHPATGRSVGYGEIVADASRLPLAARPRMKSASEQGLIGRNLRRVDTPSKVDGSAVFGIDAARAEILDQLRGLLGRDGADAASAVQRQRGR